MTAIVEPTTAEVPAAVREARAETEPPPRGVSDARPGSLKPVIDVIPARCYENPTWKGLAYLARDVAVYALVLWGLASTDTIWLLVPLWILAGLAVSALFVVGHDAAHQALFKQRWLNDLVGRVAMVPSLHVYNGWVLGHNRVHHGHTVKAGFDFVWHPVTAEQYAALSSRQRLLHRLEWSLPGAGLYYARQVWWQKMIAFRDPPPRYAKAIRRDKLLLALVVLIGVAGMSALGWSSYGTVLGAVWMVVKLGLIPFLLFSYVIGLVVHIHHIDRDITWHSRREWSKYAGQVEGTTIIHAPFWLDFFLHWILEHSPHHVDMRIPMYHLKEAGQAIAAHHPVPERKLRFRDIWANTRACKLYDFDQGQWMRYDHPQVVAALKADARAA